MEVTQFEAIALIGALVLLYLIFLFGFETALPQNLPAVRSREYAEAGAYYLGALSTQEQGTGTISMVPDATVSVVFQDGKYYLRVEPQIDQFASGNSFFGGLDVTSEKPQKPIVGEAVVFGYPSSRQDGLFVQIANASKLCVQKEREEAFAKVIRCV